jgi:methionyl-tRNA formyltransferase
MRLAVLTTDTVHHSYFVKKLATSFSSVCVLVESKRKSFPYETIDGSELIRDSYEKQRWSMETNFTIRDYADSYYLLDINSEESINKIRSYKPNLTIVFGTSILDQKLIDLCAPFIINLHGGDPEYYRGLDSHLWSIFHGDYDSLMTTLHFVSSGIDTGPIILQDQLPLSKVHFLYQLRSVNTETCVQLVSTAINQLLSVGKLCSRPQRNLGRYYSAMPSVLKEVCANKYLEYVRGKSTDLSS